MIRVPEGRFPDFIIVGAMKAGTTTLFRRLGSHPDTRLPAVKEPQFFTVDSHYRQGPASYAALFPSAGMTGEASVCLLGS